MAMKTPVRCHSFGSYGRECSDSDRKITSGAANGELVHPVCDYHYLRAVDEWAHPGQRCGPGVCNGSHEMDSAELIPFFRLTCEGLEHETAQGLE